MKKNIGKKSIGRSEDLSKKLNLFFKANNYLITLMMVVILFAIIITNSSFKSEVLEKLSVHETLLKKNLGKVHFLTAMGQHVVGEKMNLGYTDPRFKRYISNLIIDNLVQGGVELTNNFKYNFKSGEDILKSNKRFNYFYNTFLHGETRNIVILPFVRNIFLYGREGRYPEYLVTSSSKLENYTVERDIENRSRYTIRGVIRLGVFQKSYIKELNDWDNREKEMRIEFVAFVDVDSFADISNPFGLDFEKLEVPVAVKPSAADVSYRNRTKGKQ